MRDKRLLGTWKSDARRTLSDLRARRDIPAATRKVLEPLFGKLELRFTPTRCWHTLDGYTACEPYIIVAKDESSVATVSRVLETDAITHIHFIEEDVFWIHVGTGKFREFFSRVAP